MPDAPVSPPSSSVPHVVILGGGFGGLYAAKALGRAPVRVTLIDRRNHHLFQPLLYQVATAGLSPLDIAQPIRRILARHPNTRVLMGNASDIDLDRREVRLIDGDRIGYDHLILATGATHAYFGHPEWAAFAPGLKTLEDAIAMRRRFLTAFERAERATAAASTRRLLTFVIVGAGPTGVELAGTMAEMTRRSLPRDFRNIDFSLARILLIEGSPRVLGGYPEDLSASALRQLERLGVEVRLGTPVTRIEPGRVWIGPECIESDNVFWAAGVAASPLGAALGVPLDRAGRVKVDPDLTIAGHPEVSVVGDLACVRGPNGQPTPGVAPAAIQMGRYAARSILARMAGRPMAPFEYVDKGSMATIGRAAAVARLGRLRFGGGIAWLLWLFVHVVYLIGFRQKILVLLQWAWSYAAFHRGGRLITAYGEKEEPPGGPEAPPGGP